MSLTLDTLDGKYEVKSESPDRVDYTVDGDGVTEIRNGLTYRKDRNGLIWESAFTILNDNEVQMESTVDPSHAGTPTYLRDEKGNPTSGMMTFRTLMEVKHVNGKITLSGIIEHGTEKTRLTLTKV